MRTVGRQGLRHPSAMGGVCNVFRPGAAAHGWRALTFPLAPFRSHGERKGGRGGLARKPVGPRTQWSEMPGTSLMQHPGF
jgi:hypothetical protein